TLRHPVVDVRHVLGAHLVAGGPPSESARLDYLVAWTEATEPLDHRAVSDDVASRPHTPGARPTNACSDAVHAALQGRERRGRRGRPDPARYRRLVEEELAYKAQVVDRACAVPRVPTGVPAPAGVPGDRGGRAGRLAPAGRAARLGPRALRAHVTGLARPAGRDPREGPAMRRPARRARRPPGGPRHGRGRRDAGGGAGDGRGRRPDPPARPVPEPARRRDGRGPPPERCAAGG